MAWLDGDVARDFAGPAAGLGATAAALATATAATTSLTSATANSGAAAAVAAGAAGGGDIPAEVLAVLMCNGQLAFFRAAESDLWEEALEDQEAAGGRADALVPLGFSRVTSDEGLGAAGDTGDVPLAEGRRVKGMVWLSDEKLLLVAAPFPEKGFETGEGDVLLEVAVQLPPPAMFDLTVDQGQQQSQQQQPRVSVVATTYAGGAVLKAVAAAAGGGWGAVAGGAALLQLTNGSVLQYNIGGSLTSAGAVANFPCGCPVMVPLPLEVTTAGESWLPMSDFVTKSVTQSGDSVGHS
jgi:hypothetical protein